MLFQVFAELSKASARKKIYAQKAFRDGREDVACFLRAVAQSETIQARRLFNNVKGRIDMSEDYPATVFEQEIPAIIEAYGAYIRQAKEAELPAIANVLSQLRKAEMIAASFYSRE